MGTLWSYKSDVLFFLFKVLFFFFFEDKRIEKLLAEGKQDGLIYT